MRARLHHSAGRTPESPQGLLGAFNDAARPLHMIQSCTSDPRDPSSEDWVLDCCKGGHTRPGNGCVLAVPLLGSAVPLNLSQNHGLLISAKAELACCYRSVAAASLQIPTAVQLAQLML